MNVEALKKALQENKENVKNDFVVVAKDGLNIAGKVVGLGVLALVLLWLQGWSKDTGRESLETIGRDMNRLGTSFKELNEAYGRYKSADKEEE